MINNSRIFPVGIIARVFTLLFPLSQVRIRRFTCPACGAPQEDLMPNSDLCYRCYLWAMAIFGCHRLKREKRNGSLVPIGYEEPVELNDSQADGVKE